MESGSDRCLSTLVASTSPNGNHGRTPAAVNPPPCPGLHCMGVRAGVAAGVVGPVPDTQWVAQVLLGQGDIAQSDLVALVEHRRAPEAEQHQEGDPGALRVVAGPAGREAEHVVVGAGPCRPGLGRQGRLGRLDDRAQRRCLERRADEGEVEGEVQLVAGPVVGDQVVDGDGCLADQDPGLADTSRSGRANA